MHRICCGLTKEAFKKVQDSHQPYVCNYCFRDDHINKVECQKQEIASLKARIGQLESMLPVLTEISPLVKSLDYVTQTTSYAQSVKTHTNRSNPNLNPTPKHSENINPPLSELTKDMFMEYPYSVRNKITFIHSYLSSKLLDVVCFTETWLGSEDYDNEILPENYCTYRRDRGTRGGGVLIGVSKSIPSRLYLRGDNTELIAVEMLTNPSLILCCVYAPPNSSIDYCTSITNSLGSLPASKNVIILGDFNCPDINWNCLSGSTDFSTKLCDFSFEN